MSYKLGVTDDLKEENRCDVAKLLENFCVTCRGRTETQDRIDR